MITGKTKIPYTNIRLKKETHKRLSEAIKRLGTSWGRLLGALAALDDDEFDKTVKPALDKYDNDKGLSRYYVMKRLRLLRDSNPEELKRFIDSL